MSLLNHPLTFITQATHLVTAEGSSSVASSVSPYLAFLTGAHKVLCY